jgi:tetratricopeptide (TPR) repeat protein
MLRQVCEDRPQSIGELNPRIPSWLVDIIERLHAKVPTDRFQSVAEVVEAVNYPPVSRDIVTMPSRRFRTSTIVGLLLITGSLIALEAVGVTHLFSTIIRIVAGEGTLVVEIDDPKIRVVIEGTEVRIHRAGVQEIRLRPGKYRVSAADDGGPLREQLVTITRGGRDTVRVSREHIPLPNSTADWIPLFNGRDLAGWKTLPDHPGGWTVANGVLFGQTPPARYLFSERSDFRNFHLRVETRINQDGDSGIFFRVPFELRSFPNVPHAFPAGFEANIVSVPDDNRYTGTLLANTRVLARPDESPTSSDDWFTLEVIAQGNHFVVKVNGRTTADYVDRNNSYEQGHIVLQAYRAGAMPQFRKIEIREFSAPATNSEPAVAQRVERQEAIDGLPADAGAAALSLAQRGQWKEALQAFDKKSTTTPNDYVTWIRLGSLQLYLGDIEAYRRTSRELLAQFSKTTDSIAAERIARICSLDPNWEGDFSAVERLIDQTPESRWSVWDLLAKGLVEYRAGQTASAVERLNRALERSRGDRGAPTEVATHAMVLAALALAKHELGDTDAARASLESARSQIAAKTPDFVTLKYPHGHSWTPWLWYDWIHCLILVREAETMLGDVSED